MQHNQHTIRIGLDIHGNPVPVDTEGKHSKLNCVVKHGDQIRWITDGGQVVVEFQKETPFAGEMKHGDSTFRDIAAESGIFRYACSVITPDGKKHGWPQNSHGGGTVEVGSGSRT